MVLHRGEDSSLIPICWGLVLRIGIKLHYALGLLGVYITHLEFLIQLVRDEAREIVFLVCSQVELMLLVRRLLENHCSTLVVPKLGGTLQHLRNFKTQMAKLHPDQLN